MTTGHTKLAKSIWYFIQPAGVDKYGMSLFSLEPPYLFDTISSFFNKQAEPRDSIQEQELKTIIERIRG